MASVTVNVALVCRSFKLGVTLTDSGLNATGITSEIVATPGVWAMVISSADCESTLRFISKALSPLLVDPSTVTGIVSLVVPAGKSALRSWPCNRGPRWRCRRMWNNPRKWKSSRLR